MIAAVGAWWTGLFGGPEHGGVAVRRAVVLGIVIAMALATASAASAKQPKKRIPKPDLKITTFRPELGSPPHGLADSSGVLETVSVGVVIENLGNATAGASTVEVWLEDSVGRRFVKKQRVPALKPRHRWAKVVQISGAKAALGFAKLGALADAFDKVNESNEHNTVPEEEVAILAREWHPTVFVTNAKYAFYNITTSVQGGFRFVFKRFDGRYYVYEAFGSIKNEASETSLICNGTSSDVRTHNPWAGSYFKIAKDLSGYQAAINPGDAEKYKIFITCLGGGLHTEDHQFLTLDTYEGANREPTMSPNASHLSDETSDSSLFTTWKWDFQATGF
jgi:hypothetical protein